MPCMPGRGTALLLDRRRRACRAAAMLPTVTHFLAVRFHSLEARLELRAHRRLLLVVQAVVERKPGLRRFLAQLHVLLFGLLTRRMQGVQIENGLLLHGVELLAHLLVNRALGFVVALHRVEGGLPLLFLVGIQLEAVVYLRELFHEMLVHARTARAARTTGRRHLGVSGAERKHQRGGGNGENARGLLVHRDAPCVIVGRSGCAIMDAHFRNR
ncbi:protein of unknown function [Paraburkholderia kururiensis]